MADRDSFAQQLTEKTQKTDRIVRQYLPEENGRHSTLLRAMNYSVQVGGKRLRPLMIRETYRIYGADRDEIVGPFMAAMEFIHTHSLVHDDLPAMDNDRYRRGKETTHVVFGEAMAILAGDGLLNYAYETASRAFEASPGDEHIGLALGILAAKAGIAGMIGGQSVDVELDGQELDKDTLQFIYERKTGALIEGSLMIGAALAGAAPDQLNALERIGRLAGVAFQIRDDILDVEGDEYVLGKPLHSDEKNHKTTYVTLEGLDASRRKVEELSDEAAALLDDLHAQHSTAFLKALILSLAGRDR